MATRSIFSTNPAMAQRRIAALKQFLPSLPHSLLGLACVALLCLTYISLRSLTPSNASTPYHSTGSLSFSHASNSQDVEDIKMTTSSIYHYPGVFLKNYQAMKKDFKVYIYPDGDPKTYYQTPRKLTGKYCSEGYFFQNIRESHFRTDDPDKAHLFFVPISPHKMRGMGTSYENMTIIVRDYVLGLIQKYPYWNRTLGADHFFVACQDVGVRAFEGLEMMVKNSIRVVCSPSYNVGYVPHKDVALPQILQPFALPAGGNDIENRTILAFWAGHRNSKIRVILARVWENDTELSISNNRINRATGPLVYQRRFYNTKFCICPGGSQVNSARIMDSIHYGCIPVILSDYYDLPFNDILDWSKFSLILKERDVYQLKDILKSVSHDQFVALHNNLVEVQKHFEWHSPPIPHDTFHMTMYELWLRHHVIRY
ncbi:putative glycosyltransferase At5g03795 [Carex rostrata]